jgi:drug/metabolite transporter (DMT)-like permease
MIKNKRYIVAVNKNNTITKLFAFSAIYIIWGTTYLAIRLAIDTIPPFFMAGLRFTTAGLLFYSWCYWRFDKKPDTKDWRKAAIPAIFMFVLGNGTLTWSEQFIPSGLAALILATLPIWMILIDWIFAKGRQPDTLTITGITLGLIGVALLTGIDESILIRPSEQGISVISGIFILVFAAMSWAAGSLFARYTKSSLPLQFTISMQIIVGGIVLIIISLFQGEWSRFHMQSISFISLMSMGYLIFFGTLLAYSAYIWLLRVSTPAKVGTYAFFNPLIAVFLGWLLIDEPITSRTLVGAGFILISLLLVNQPRLNKNISNQKKHAG